VELLEDPSIKEYAKKLYDKWLQKKDKLAQLGVPEVTLEKLEKEAKADIAKELGKVKEKLTFYEGIAESPEYEEAPIVRTGVRRKPYRALATALAQELGVPVPKSAKTLGKTWKEIYQQLLKEKEKK
jgi:DNA-binding Xre family transcriptional regulator